MTELLAIARHLAMTAPAVHYYFPSRQALLDALIIDGFTSLAEALRTACEGSGPRLPGEQWLAVCRAHRAWPWITRRSTYCSTATLTPTPPGGPAQAGLRYRACVSIAIRGIGIEGVAGEGVPVPSAWSRPAAPWGSEVCGRG